MIGPNGLLWGFDWLVDGPWWVVLLKCWALTPLMMFVVIGPLLESRWLSLNLRKQYLSFFPGDFFVGLGVTMLVLSNRQHGISGAWYDAAWIHVLILSITAIVAVVLTRSEVKNGYYPKRAMLSPTKIYHNGVLYAGYGYIGFMLFLQATSHLFVNFPGTLLWWLGAFAAFGVWGYFIKLDNSINDETRKLKAATAHISNWHPFWFWFRTS